MKWIKSRSRFINEAKIRDVINKKQKELVSRKWGEKFLDYDEVEPTDKIKQGYWKLSDEDKNKVLSAFFSSRSKLDISETFKIFSELPEKFVEVVNLSLANISDIDADSLGLERAKEVLQEFDIKNPSIDEMVAIFEPVFRKLSNETGKNEMIQKDENGRPIMGENNRPLKVAKEIGDPVFERNLININSFVQNYNTYYPEHSIPDDTFSDYNLTNIINLVKDDINSEYKTSFKIFGRDIYLKISHNPKDILNMSISKFYTSCKHLYSGMYNSKVLGNVFDPNSIPAYLVFDTPIYNGDEVISEQLPLSRMIIRNIESFDGKGETKLFFDRAYPDRMKEGVYDDIFGEIVTKYTGMVDSKDTSRDYIYSPDIDPEDLSEVPDPYHDRLDDVKVKYIGVNTKKLYLSSSEDWSRVKISPKAKIKELIIENPDLPSNIFEIGLSLDWIKFKIIDIKDLSIFSKIKSNSIAFDKCKLSNDSLIEICNNNDVKKLQLVSCDIDELNLSGLDIEELQLIYTVDNNL